MGGVIAKLKLLFLERVDENICTRWWMKHAYWDYMNRERVMVAFPLNYIVTLAWRLNLLWNKFRHKPTWIDFFSKQSAMSRTLNMSSTLDTSSLKESFRSTMREYYPVALGDTPETDALKNKWAGDPSAPGYTEALEEKCRSLEKDRNELLKWSHAELSIQTGLVAAYKVYYDFYQENKNK